MSRISSSSGFYSLLLRILELLGMNSSLLSSLFPILICVQFISTLVSLSIWSYQFSNFQKFPQTYGLLVISFLVPQLVINAFFNCIFCVISIRFWQREEVNVCTQSAILKWKSSPVFDPQLSFYRQSKCNLSPVRRFQFKLSFSF